MAVIAVLALLLPGYALARALRLPAAWTTAFPFSALMLTEVVIVFALIGVPIRFSYVLGTLAIVSLMPLAVSMARRSADVEVTGGAPQSPDSRMLRTLAVVFAGLILVGMVVRAARYPLSGPDIVFRWEALARAMLAHEGLSYYPPIHSGDFKVYLFPDGIPPLVATVYWWLYAAWGEPFPALTSVPIALQTACCLSLTYLAGRELSGPAGGWLALAVLSCSTLFLSGVAIGQETGYTALSVAGQLAFGLAAIRTPRATLIVGAGLFAALAGLARDYGPALSGVGFAILATRRETRRYLPLFCLISIFCAGPWYVRTWVRTGNPLYPRDLGLGLPGNPIETGLVATYKTIFGLHTFTVMKWRNTLALIATGAPLAVFVGTPALAVAGKRAAGLTLSVLLVAGLWLLAVGFVTGGVAYSLRVLTPAWVSLSVASSVFGPHLARMTGALGSLVRLLTVLALVACGSYATLSCWSFPAPVAEIRQAVFSRRSDPLDRYAYYVRLAKLIDRSGVQPSRILTDNYYLATVLKRRSRFDPVMAWDPEVAFVFDTRLPPETIRQRLRERGIEFVALQKKSSNNNYLLLYRFYREDWKHWIPAWIVPELDLVYLLPPVR